MVRSPIQKTVIFFLFPFILTWMPPSLLGQDLSFEHIGKEEGLDYVGTVNQIFQDKKGFIWLGTTDGLVRYDGKNTRSFRHNRRDSTSLSNNSILCIMEDQEGHLWIGTKNGLNCYFPETESFKHYTFPGKTASEKAAQIHDVLQDRQGIIWVGTYEGLHYLNPKTGEQLQFLPQVENNNSLTGRVVWKIFEDDQGRLWFGTSRGLTLYDNRGDYQFEQFLPQLQEENGLKCTQVWEFKKQANGTIWIGGNGGLLRVVEENGKIAFQHFNHDPQNANSLSDDFIQSIWCDSDDRLWVGTYRGGVNEIQLKPQKTTTLAFTHHKHDPLNPASLRLNIIKDIFRDRSGILWIATASGVDRFAPSAIKFAAIKKGANLQEGLSSKIIKATHLDRRGNLWIGTYNGLNWLSAENLKKENYQFKIFKHQTANSNSLSHNNIFGLYEDSKGLLWVSTYNGLNYIDLAQFPEKPVFQKLFQGDGLPDNFIYDVLEISENKYWVATYGQLAKMFFDSEQPEKIQFQNYDMDADRMDALVNATTYKVCQDRFGQYWIATFDGLSRYVEKNGEEYFDNYKNIPGDTTSLSNNSVIDLHLDQNDRLWVGTRGGLNLVVQNGADERAHFQSYDRFHGLSNGVIQTIEEDADGFLWLGTNNGLNQFDPEAALAGKPPVKKIYWREDGLSSAGIIFRSTHVDKKGRHYLGTAGGVNFFHPKYLPSNTYIPPIVFTDLEILNEPVRPGSSPKLPRSMIFTDTIVLEYWENVFSITFAALDFSRPKKNQYQHRLIGFDPKWINNENDNRVTYTNLSAGTYLLEVKGSNNDGLWNEAATKLTILIHPPPWKTNGAYAAYLLLFVGSIYTFIRYRIKRRIAAIAAQAEIERARFEEREHLRKQNAADFHDELGHRLTKISLFLELANRQEKAGPKVKEYLHKIKNHSTALSEGIRDLIWSLDPQKDSLFQTLLRLQEFGDTLFEEAATEFTTTGITTPLLDVPLDPNVRKHLLLIFKEAMHNCLKYAEANQACLKVEAQAQTIRILFEDDGKGFELENIKKGYGLNNMQKRATQIGASLHLSTKPNTGVVIYVDLKKN